MSDGNRCWALGRKGLSGDRSNVGIAEEPSPSECVGLSIKRPSDQV